MFDPRNLNRNTEDLQRNPVVSRGNTLRVTGTSRPNTTLPTPGYNMPLGHGIEESSHLSRSLSPNRFNNQALVVELEEYHRSLTPQPVRNSQPFLTPSYSDGSRSSSHVSIYEKMIVFE